MPSMSIDINGLSNNAAVIKMFYTAHDFMIDFPWDECRKIYTSANTSLLIPLSFLSGQAQEDCDYLIVSAYTDAVTILREWLHIQKMEKASNSEEYQLKHSTELLCQILCRAYHYRHDSYFMILSIVFLMKYPTLKHESLLTSFLFLHYQDQSAISITTTDFSMLLSLSLLKIQEIVHIHIPLALEAAGQRSKKARKTAREFHSTKVLID